MLFGAVCSQVGSQFGSCFRHAFRCALFSIHSTGGQASLPKCHPHRPSSPQPLLHGSLSTPHSPSCLPQLFLMQSPRNCWPSGLLLPLPQLPPPSNLAPWRSLSQTTPLRLSGGSQLHHRFPLTPASLTFLSVHTFLFSLLIPFFSLHFLFFPLLFHSPNPPQFPLLFPSFQLSSLTHTLIDFTSQCFQLVQRGRGRNIGRRGLWEHTKNEKWTFATAVGELSQFIDFSRL